MLFVSCVKLLLAKDDFFIHFQQHKLSNECKSHANGMTFVSLLGHISIHEETKSSELIGQVSQFRSKNALRGRTSLAVDKVTFEQRKWNGSTGKLDLKFGFSLQFPLKWQPSSQFGTSQWNSVHHVSHSKGALNWQFHLPLTLDQAQVICRLLLMKGKVAKSPNSISQMYKATTDKGLSEIP